MKKLLGILALLAVGVAGGGSLAWNLAMAGPGGCPAALLQGTLVELGGTLGVRTSPGGELVRVSWPFGYGVGREGDTLVLTRVFAVVARQGDEVSMAGAAAGDTGPDWVGCGPVSLGLLVPAEPTPTPRPSWAAGATLTVTGTAYEPCLPPPSGCGYRVSLTSASGGTLRAELAHSRSYENASAGKATPLTLIQGLPPELPPGAYDLVFETLGYSDVESLVPLEDGTMGSRPEATTACAKHVAVQDWTQAVRVDVTFRGSSCTVRVTRVDGAPPGEGEPPAS
jgi:hypothetical protein